MLPTIDTKVGERIKARREELGLGQRDAAPEDYSATFLSLIENGRRTPSWQALDAIAAALEDNTFRLADGTARQLVPA